MLWVWRIEENDIIGTRDLSLAGVSWARWSIGGGVVVTC